MKYVKSIGLFFVYPLLCLALGLFAGEVLSVKKISGDLTANYPEKISETTPPVIIYDEGDAMMPELEMENQNVMNPEAIVQFEDKEAEIGYFVVL